MLDSSQTPGNPQWWLLYLGNKLNTVGPQYDRLDRYWRGDHPLPFGNKRMREAYRQFQLQARTNYVKLVAESVIERIKINAFRIGGADNGDKQALAWWQTNDMASNSSLVHRASVTMGMGYAIVGKDPVTGKPLVTPEDPRQVVHESDPTNRRKVRASMKTWIDEVYKKQVAIVFLDEFVYYYRATNPVNKEGGSGKKLWDANKWEIDDSVYENGVAPNPLGSENPVVPFYNMPDLGGGCLGEFEDVTPIQDRINTQVLDRMVVSAMQAYRQRYAIGVDPTDDNGNPQQPWDPGADILWIVEDDKVKFGEFEQVDLTPILKAIEADATSLAAITRTPPSYMIGAIVNASGDALAAAESGLVSKVKERCTEFGGSWKIVHRLCALINQDEPQDDVEVLWDNPQFRTDNEIAAAAVQMQTAGVPWRTRMEFMGYSPPQIDRMMAERAADALLTPNPDIVTTGSVSNSTSNSTSTVTQPAVGGQGGAAQPAADITRAQTTNRTGQQP